MVVSRALTGYGERPVQIHVMPGTSAFHSCSHIAPILESSWSSWKTSESKFYVFSDGSHVGAHARFSDAFAGGCHMVLIVCWKIVQ